MKATRMQTFRIFSALALVLAGCTRQQPRTEVPPSPAIELFTASATQVGAGDAVTLSWKVAHATGLELREATQGSLGVPPDQFEGSITVNPTTTSLYLLTVRGEAGTDARAVAVNVGGSNTTVSFRALPPVIAGGDVTTLVWLAAGAQVVTLSDGTNALETEGQVSAGALTVAPSADTTYTLEVDGTKHTVDVTVQPAILSFTSDPTAVEAGQQFNLSWEAVGATRVQLTGVGRGVLHEATGRVGAFTDTAPMLPNNSVLTYELLAEKGTQRMTRTIEVFVGTGLTITQLDAPAVAAQGGNYSLRWQTVAADQVEVRINGAITFSTANPSQARQGSATIPTPAEDFGVELIATNTRGARVTRSTQVEVVGVPSSITLTASPTTVAAGGAVTLTWDSPETRRIRLVDGDGQPVYAVTGQMAESGSTTVYPPHSGTTYRIVGDNLLGSAPLSATTSVTVTGTPLDVVQVPMNTINGSSFNAVPNDAQAVLVGFPHRQVLAGTRADFIDISATGERLDITATPGVVNFDTGFDTWMWGEKQPTLLTVSRAGWMAFGPSVAVSTTNYVLPSTSAPNNVIAPFWDSLTITANSAITWQKIGEAPNERLIVQWDRMQVGTDTDTELTFQVQVHQNGSVAFQYKTVVLSLPYTSFTIGLQDQFARRGVSSDVTPESDTALYFFSPIAATAELQARRRSRWGGFIQKNGVSAFVSHPASVISMPEDLAVTEVLFKPTVAEGQYAEFLNRSALPIDLTGWFITSPTGARFNFPAGFTLLPDVNVVLGATVDPTLNDDAGVSLSWGDAGFSLPPDGGVMFIGTGDAGFSISLRAADAGVATIVDPGLFRIGSATSVLSVCTATTPFGAQTPRQLGNPGMHAGCGFGYRSRSITPHFVDISDGGTNVSNTASVSVDDFTTPITLASSPSDPQPVVFGVPRPVVSMSADGFVTPFSTTVVTATNKTNPAAAAGQTGAIAAFWDDLWTIPGRPGSDMFWKHMAVGEDPLRPESHWIFQWNRVAHFNTNPADDLTFEVKLFEDGVVEYHYATMISGTSAGYADGNSATVWLDAADAGAALLDSVNAPEVRPHSALQFLPQ